MECGRRETLPWETTERLLHRLLPTTSTRTHTHTRKRTRFISGFIVQSLRFRDRTRRRSFSSPFPTRISVYVFPSRQNFFLARREYDTSHVQLSTYVRTRRVSRCEYETGTRLRKTDGKVWPAEVRLLGSLEFASAIRSPPSSNHRETVRRGIEDRDRYRDSRRNKYRYFRSELEVTGGAVIVSRLRISNAVAIIIW